MQYSRTRAIVSLSLVMLLTAGPSVAQLCPPAVDPGVDNRDGYLPPFEEQPVRPMTLSSDRKQLWVLNIPDSRVSVFDATNPTAGDGPKLIDEVGVGLGPVAIQRRPSDQDDREMWVVCTSSNSVFVIDERNRRVITTIRVEHEPGDLVFAADGRTAYVSLAASNQIAVIDAGARTVTSRIEFDSNLPTTSTNRLHAEEPLTLMLEGDDLYGISHVSGNGTLANPALCPNPTPPPNNVPCFPGSGVPNLAQLWDVFNAAPTGPEPPDRDVVRFDVNAPAAAGTVVGWRFGTINFDLQREPGGPDMVVSNVDLRNDSILTEQLYPKDVVEFGKPSIHRISMGPDATSATSNQTVAHFDLNDPANVNAVLEAEGYRCAFPTQMAFNDAGDRLYVACYGTNNVAVTDYPPTQVIAELRSRASVADKTGFGTHGLLLDEARGVVYSYEQGDGSLQIYRDNPGTGTVNAPVHSRPISIGFDITPEIVEAGRFHFNNAANSAFGTDSCATCHYRAHADGVAWDLSDLSGDIPDQPGQPLGPTDRFFFRDNKGLKVTMSLRGIEETPPFHWRGDRADLKDFAGAVVGLIGGEPLSEEEVEQVDRFVFPTSYRPNPDQSFDRSYSAQALDGAGCFTNPLSLTFGSDTNGGALPLACEDCHSMAGFSGTNNQVNNDGRVIDNIFVFNPVPEDATQLRGLWDKSSDQYDYPPTAAEPIFPVTGWGFANSGAIDSFQQFVEIAGGGLGGQAQKDAVKAFFTELDTGMAPTTAYAWTMDAVSVGAIPPEAVQLIVAANAGHNDVVVRGWIDFGLGAGPETFDMFRLGNLFYPNKTGVGPFTAGQLIAFANPGDGDSATLTFMGMPVGMGYRGGFDRDMDMTPDGDELAVCPSPPAVCSSYHSTDTDDDSFPDGYETRLGSNPNDATSLPSGDSVAPNILSPEISWFNSNVAKVRWTTDEESISRVIVRENGAIVSTSEDLTYKWQHSQVVRDLIAGRTYTVEIESGDPANPTNSQTFVFPNPLGMQPRLFLNTMHVETTNLKVVAIGIPGGNFLLRATFQIHDGATSAPLANHPVTIDYEWYEWVPGGTGAIVAHPVTFSGTTNAQGRISDTFSTSNVTTGQGGVAEVISRNVSESVAFRMLFQPESGAEGFGTRINLP
ncbi:MAG: hypothetical protein GY719_19285 [bacterium]|nr:hypothetical protein [bacterium]